MDKNKLITIGIIAVMGLFIGVISLISVLRDDEKNDLETHELSGVVMQYNDNVVTIQDETMGIYTCNVDNATFDVGDSVTLEYTSILNNNYTIAGCEVISYEVVDTSSDKTLIPAEWADKGIFSDYYTLALNKLKSLTLDEKIGQLLLVRYPSKDAVGIMNKYHLGGYVFFEKDFKDKSLEQVKDMINVLQSSSKIPLLTAVDEEGGSVVRVSSNPNLRASKFEAPSELYNAGGLDKIKEDTIEKSKFLNGLGLNLNLAPVVDVSTNSSDYMYNRSLKQDTSVTSEFAKTVINASKNTHVSYTLKHFPGYGNNADTHTGAQTDNRSYDDLIKNDIPPFKAGIDAGAEAVLVAHNTVTAIDSNNPASLSQNVHNLLRNELGFTGIIVTDDIAMGALGNIDDVTVKAILAGNDLIITTDYEESFNSIKSALETGKLSEAQIDKLAFRVLSWKYHKMLMFDNEK